MKLSLVTIAPPRRAVRNDPAQLLAQDYATRSGRMAPLDVLSYPDEAALFEALSKQAGRVPAQLCFFDPTGDSISSEQFAHYIERVRDGGAQRMIFAVGPADGWSEPSLRRAHRILALGKMTLPHELARVVVAEQVYRALTILAGHPYHRA